MEAEKKAITLSPGLHRNLAMSEYLMLDALGASDLWTLHETCPAIARYRKLNPNHDTPAKALGTAMHTLTLEPSQFAARYAVRPEDGPRANSNAYKDWAAPHISAGREIITRADWTALQAMHAGLPQEARKLLAKGEAEVTALCRHEETGLLLRTRPDWLRAEGVVIDVKTTIDPKPSAWAKQAANLGYHMSAALCVDILKEITGQEYEYHYLVIGKEPPCVSYLATLEPRAIEHGRQLYQPLLKTWAACLKAGEWPAWGSIVPIELPAWAYPKDALLDA